MLVLNYAHPLTVKHRSQLEEMTSEAITDVREIPTHLDIEAPFNEQIIALAEGADLTPTQWQTEPLLVVLPALNYAAAALLAELHGRMGYFPPIVRLRPMEGKVPPRYEIAEVMDLQALRQAARQRRYPT
jgi:hypothetical protein